MDLPAEKGKGFALFISAAEAQSLLEAGGAAHSSQAVLVGSYSFFSLSPVPSRRLRQSLSKPRPAAPESEWGYRGLALGRLRLGD